MAKKITIILIFFLLMALFSPAKAAPESEKIDNKVVIDLSRSGLSDNAIIALIKKNKHQFDLSPSALISLKKNGVSDRVIEYVLGNAKSGSGLADNSSSGNDLPHPIPKNYGIYFVLGKNLLKLGESFQGEPRLFTGRVKILIYDSRVDYWRSTLKLVGLKYLRNKIFFATHGGQTKIDKVNKWRKVMGQKYGSKNAKNESSPSYRWDAQPVPGRSDMLYLMITGQLSDGVYAIMTAKYRSVVDTMSGERDDYLYMFSVGASAGTGQLERLRCVDLVRGSPRGGWDSWFAMSLNAGYAVVSCDSSPIRSKLPFSTTSHAFGAKKGKTAPPPQPQKQKASVPSTPAIKSKSGMNKIVAKGTISSFKHGTLVYKQSDNELSVALDFSKATHIHPGVDIAAPQGSPIYPAANGHVHDIIADSSDPNWPALGYVVIVQHEKKYNGKKTYSTYFHLGAKPNVQIGQKVYQGVTKLGVLGSTGNATGPHLHFEIRHFPERFSNNKLWNSPPNIYGKFPQSAKLLKSEWSDPVEFLKN
jgi:hypothetical protein